MIDIIDMIANFFLSFSHETIIIPLIIIGYIWFDQKTFYHAVCLMFLSILFNNALKITFKVPLAPSLGKQGFAFPSGHMQLAVVLYGWLISKTDVLKYKNMILSLIVGVGLSLVYFGYHNLVDILGAIFSGVLLTFFYSWLVNRKGPHIEVFAVSLSTLLMLYIEFIYKIAQHVRVTYCALIGICLAERIFSKYSLNKELHSKILSTILCFAFVILFQSVAAPKSLYEYYVSLALRSARSHIHPVNRI